VLRVLALVALVAGAMPAVSAPAAGGPGPVPRNADVYLVPVGELPGELLLELAGYCRRALGLEAAVVGPLPLLPAAVDPARRQLVAEELTALLARGLDAWVRNPDALIVGITGHDLYTRSASHLRFLFGHRDGERYAVLSAARMDTADGLTPGRRAGLRKLLIKDIGLQLYGLPPSRDPTSVLYGRIGGLADLRRIDESSVGRDVLDHPERARWHARRDARPPPPPEPGPTRPSALERWGILAACGLGCAAVIGLAIAWHRRIQRRWRELAARHGWCFRALPGPWYRSGTYALELEVAGVPLVVDWFETGGYRSRVQWTRVRAQPGTGDVFRIQRESVGTRLRRRFGRLQEATLGEPSYDEAFLIQGGQDLLHRLPVWLRRRHLREPHVVECGEGGLVILRHGLPDTDEALLGLVQLAADFVCVLRDRPRVEIAPDAARDRTPSLEDDPLTTRRSPWRRAAGIAAVVFGIAYFAGGATLLFVFATERTNEPWRIAALGLGPVLTLGYLALLARNLRRLAQDFATHALPLLVGLPMVLALCLLFAGPWVTGWNAWRGSHEAYIYGPVVRRQLVGGRGGPDHLITIADSTTGRDVRLEVTEALYVGVRQGDPVAFAMRLGGLGIWYRQRWP
jgi:hypothetical protein